MHAFPRPTPRCNFRPSHAGSYPVSEIAPTAAATQPRTDHAQSDRQGIAGLHRRLGGAYRVVAKAAYEHQPIITGSGRKVVQTFPWIHTFIGNMKRMILGTHHWISRNHVDDDLAEFPYRASRPRLEGSLFHRLVVAALDSKAVTYKALTAGATYRISKLLSAPEPTHVEAH